ncbi:MAG: LPS export ABC transporter permease LptF [Acidobacteriota bacterium]
MLRRLDRYIFGEILGPLGLGFIVYSFIMLLGLLFRLADMIIRKGVSIDIVGRLLMLSLPSVVVMAIPMSLLFGILIAVGRLSADSELTAIRASGISLFSLYRPILLLSAVLTLFNVYLMLDVLPKGNTAFQELQLEIVSQSLTRQVEPREFYPGFEGRLLYVFETPLGESRWKGAFLADAIPQGENEMIVAEWGYAQTDEQGEQAVLVLENARNHRVDLNKPGRYDVIHQREIVLQLDAERRQRSRSSSDRSLRELTLEELEARAADPNLPTARRRQASVEIHKKFSIPFACMVFGLLALPLGFTNKRGGRSSGFAISIGVILLYYVLLNWGEDFARRGEVSPWLAVWFANFLFLAVGLVLLTQKNRDKSLMLRNVDQWIQHHVWSRIRRAQQRREEERRERLEKMNQTRRQGADLVLRLPPLQLRFPNAIDRYVLITFLRVLLMAFLMGITVYLIADISEHVDDIVEHEVSSEVVVEYYQFRIFTILYEILPIIVLVSVLVAFGLLSRTNEVTAFKALGISLYRLSIPVILAAMVIALLAGLLQSEVLAAANARVAELEDVIKGKGPSAQAQRRRVDRQWFYGRGGYIYNYMNFDAERRLIQRLQVFRFDDDHRLTDRLFVERATFVEDDWWLFEGGWRRSFSADAETSFTQFDEPVKAELPEPIESFTGEIEAPEEMRYRALEQHIELLRETGQEAPMLEVELHNRIAYPAISLVMALVALPFAFRLGRRGALYGIGLSLLLGIVFMALLAMFTALGEAGILPPLIAVWSPGVIFSVFSLYLFLGVQT